MQYREILHGSAAYDEMIQLRLEVLLHPIGISESYINRLKEKEETLLAGFQDQEMVCCCILTSLGEGKVQLRQMATKLYLQHQGIGSGLLHFAEEKARASGFSLLILHARENVSAFYFKNKYALIGEKFMEVGIPHVTMQKKLAD